MFYIYALPDRLSRRREGDWRSLAPEEYCSKLSGRWRWECAGNIVPGSDCFCRLNSIFRIQRNRQSDRPQRTLVSPLKSWNQGLYSSIEAATVMRPVRWGLAKNLRWRISWLSSLPTARWADDPGGHGALPLAHCAGGVVNCGQAPPRAGDESRTCASWGGGSGSVTGFRGGTASWGGGSGSDHGAYVVPAAGAAAWVDFTVPVRVKKRSTAYL